MELPIVPAGLWGQRFQGPGGIRAAQSGSSVEVDVGPNDSEITIVDTASGERSTYPVAPGKTTKIPLPPAPPGTAINVTIGRGRNARTIVFEIIGTPP
jgi:hypothetical protein